MDSSESESGDICGIIEADGLALEELPVQGQVPGSKGWRVSVLHVLAPRHPVVEDEDGDLAMPRGELQASPAPELLGWRIELARLASSQLHRVGLQLWAGALVLSDFLLWRPEVVRDKKVCELGAGLGLCSLLAGRLGAQVLCTDGSAEACENCRRNLQQNGAKAVTVEVLRWEAPPSLDVGEVWQCEVLLAADVIYDAEAAASFAQLASQLLKKRARALYLSLEKRVYFSSTTLKPEVAAYPQFWEDCEALGLNVESVDLSSIPVHFNYLRSRFYDLVVITARCQKRKVDDM